jgi:hypothetical protein
MANETKRLERGEGGSRMQGEEEALHVMAERHSISTMILVHNIIIYIKRLLGSTIQKNQNPK